MGAIAAAKALGGADWRLALNMIRAKPIHAEPTPKLVDNVALVIDAQTNVVMGKAFTVTASTVSHWRANKSIPLFYIAPILRVMSWEELAHGDLDGSHHVGRGWTRELDVGARHPDEPGPINLGIRLSFEDVFERMKLLAGDGEMFRESVEATANQITQWRKRARIPDNTYRSFCDRHNLSLSWLLTGAIANED